jgi:branched-chain amino acid transport system permease protein
MNWNRAYLFAGSIFLIFLLVLPWIFPVMLVHMTMEIFYFALFAVSFNLVFGYAGLLPFGHGALFGIGAYAAALVFNHLPQLTILPGLLIASLSGLVGGLLIGVFCVRLSGPYFSLASLAFQMFFFAVALKWRSVTHGSDGMGITRPELYLPLWGSLPSGGVHTLYYLTFIMAGLGIIACYFFLKTPLGNSILCLRENETRASFLGYGTYLTKLTMLSVSGVLAGLAGGLFALFQGFVSTTCIDVNMSMIVMFMVVIGGLDYFLGPVIGAAFYLVFQDWLMGVTRHWWLFMGIVFVIVVLYLEGGIIELFKFVRIRRGMDPSGNKK